MPPSTILVSFVVAVASCLGMNASEIVMAYITVEAVACRHPALVQRETVRPLMMNAMVASVQLSYDQELSLAKCVDRLSDIINLSIPMLRVQQAWLCKLIDWKFPVRPVLFPIYAHHLAAEASMRLGFPVPTPVLPLFFPG